MRLERGRKRWDELLQFVEGQARQRQELYRAVLHVGELDLGQAWCLL